jgi:hypothetical protein
MNISVSKTSKNDISADQPLFDDDQYGHEASFSIICREAA